jgi:hypothetical protein
LLDTDRARRGRKIRINGGDSKEYRVPVIFFQRKMNDENAFGGWPSVRRDKSKKMMIKIGHNEAIMKQYLLTKKMERSKWRFCIGS